ncbi:MAG: phosphatidate cytidylyltransferase [Lachnospiraceae bacterium]|nr:phosphatidate cytidylyltransferase [Lachnospiraceae bacterium]
MKTRIISGAVLVLILGSALLTGKYYLWALCLFISIVGFIELSKAMAGITDEKLKVDPMDILGIAGIIAYYILILFYPNKSINMFLFFCILFLIAEMILYVLTFPKFSTEKMFSTFFGMFYTGVCVACIYLVRNRERGIRLVWLIFISSWICDTCAYFSGVALGKHRLAPILSPKKSVEGAIGGVVGSTIIGGLFAAFAMKEPKEIVFIYMIICAAGAVISQFGDLFASALKRKHDIKDYGRLIPGHGGILDRFDSVIITAPIVYMLSVFIK